MKIKIFLFIKRQHLIFILQGCQDLIDLYFAEEKKKEEELKEFRFVVIKWSKCVLWANGLDKKGWMDQLVVKQLADLGSNPAEEETFILTKKE